jgi:chorismate mutase
MNATKYAGIASLTIALALAAVPTATATPTATAEQQSAGRLGSLTELAVQRIEVGDLVAASKFGTDKPIEDPVREKQVLDAGRASAITLGLNPDETVSYFRDQIEASKIVQRGLFARWTAHPGEAPTTRPDLNEIRLKLDQLTTSLLTELVHTTRTRHAGLRCTVDLTAATITAKLSNHLDRLHSNALNQASASVCVS